MPLSHARNFWRRKLIVRLRCLYGEGGPGPKDTAMSVTFELAGQRFIALNGGPQFTFTDAISFLINCETQQEVDDLWEKLSAGGTKSKCGWLKDKYGLSWQVIPIALGECCKTKIPKNRSESCKPCCEWTRSTLPL
jgi:predicted 3-demethylubiquinone-9 3-methyltransferase (glyoxalase superfamily)